MANYFYVVKSVVTKIWALWIPKIKKNINHILLS